MNKVFYINLGGYPLSIDEDAYELLDKYIQKLEKHFERSEGKEEIIADIETRIAEISLEHVKGGQIVNIRAIKYAIDMMGAPEEFEGSAMDTENPKEQKSGSEFKINPGKRLFRNPDDKVIGGVCSGISVYFGIKDPIWLRIIAVLLLFSGFGVMAYFILWIIMPEAKTSADRLAMRGEPVNIDSIAAKVEEQLDELSDRINDLGKGWKERRRKRRKF